MCESYRSEKFALPIVSDPSREIKVRLVRGELYIATGSVSGNLEVLHIGRKVFSEWVSLVSPELFVRLIVETLAGGNRLVFYQCEGKVEQSQLLAHRRDDDHKFRMGIESCGERGFFRCVPVFNPLNMVGGHNEGFHELPVLTMTEREMLVKAAAALNENGMVRMYPSEICITEKQMAEIANKTK